jgi:hypothetical protein
MTDRGHHQPADHATWDATQRGPVRRYKGHGNGSHNAPRCIACFPRSVAGQTIPLRYGVTIALCPDHRDPAFIRSRGGRDFLAALSTTYHSLGLHGARYHNALHAFIADAHAMNTPTPRHRPGSYAWPDQRRHAEAIWAAGGDYHDGEAIVLSYFTAPQPGIRPPSPHTIRRWWRDRRWLTPRPTPPPRHHPSNLTDHRTTTHLNRTTRHPHLAATGIPRVEPPPPGSG